jgi:hypothetical protein
VPLGKSLPSTHTLSKKIGTSDDGRSEVMFDPKALALLEVGEGALLRFVPAVTLRLNS